MFLRFRLKYDVHLILIFTKLITRKPEKEKGKLFAVSIVRDFFRKRHVRKSAVAIIAEYTYTWHRCQGGKLNVNAKRGGNVIKRGKGDSKGQKTSTKSTKNKN